MAKLEVSEATYNELSILLKRTGREINDGAALTIEKGTAIMPPHDFRMVTIRQNSMITAAEVYKTLKAGDPIKIAQDIFDWVLNGENKNGQSTPKD